MNAPLDARSRNRNRWMLVLIAAIFFGTAALAGALRFSGWRPEGMKNHGELLQPPADLRAMSPSLSGGGTYEWRPVDRTWRILVAPRAGCGEPCVALSRDLDKVWQLFGREADRVHVLWLGPAPPDAVRNEAWHELAPDPALRALLPGVDATAAGGDADGVPVYVVDPNGFVILRHAPGFDPADLRQDMARLLKLK